MTISIPQISNIIYPRILNSHSKALTKLQTDYSKGQTTVQRGQILEKNGTVFNRHSTDMFRDDINWHFFAKYLNSRYRDDKNVNIYIHACSDGSEAYSMAILCDKYFPKTKKIIAKDISADVIRQNQLRQNRAARTTNRVDKSAQDALDLKNEELDKYFSYS
ncbi:hypothetical protein IJ670_06320, partial [bacterium]|nr:hypothetical protein [bacterium]